MPNWKRRQFLRASAAAAAGPVFCELGALGQLSRAVAADPQIDPSQVRRTPSIEQLIALIQATPRAQCTAVFVKQLEAGLSYHDFLSALFLATVDHGDPHQVAGVYAAHRISSEAPAEQRLLPLFWALDRVARGFEEQAPQRFETLEGLPAVKEAAEAFGDPMAVLDPEAAERAIVALARAHGARRAMPVLWQWAARRVHGTLGHHPIMLANAWRTLEALSWERAEPVLRYLARAFPSNEADRTYAANLERARKAASKVPADWTSREPNREITLEVFNLLRTGKTDETCDHICALLTSKSAQAGAVWDAVHLVAADLLVSYKSGGSVIGGYLIHAVTSTNALRFGFDAAGEDPVRLLLLLQAVSALGDLFVGAGLTEDQLRDKSLLDLNAERAPVKAGFEQVFAMLPAKANDPNALHSAADRAKSDQASATCFGMLQTADGQQDFKRIARSLLCLEATDNPHDLKYPVAAFEDARQVSPPWRPYLLAASVHALHGSASADAAVLVQARQALRMS